MNNVKLSDILLLPKEFYKRINSKKTTLILGILIVGFVDLLSPFTDMIPMVFFNKSKSVLNSNLVFSAIFILVLGFFDTFFFSRPLSDFFRFLKRDQDSAGTEGRLTKLMKIYITAHLLVIPVSTLIYFWGSRVNPVNSPSVIYLIALYFYIISPLWFSGIIARGVNTVYSFEPVFGNLVFLVVFFWNFLLSAALDFVTGNIMTHLFK